MRTAIFVDGANLAATCRALGFFIDFNKLRKWMEQEHDVIRCSYYTAIAENGDTIKALRDWLDYNGWRIVAKPAKHYEQGGIIKTKGNMDVEIVVDMMRLAPHLEHIILASGDGDFCSAVLAVQDMGCKVTVLSSIAMQPPIIADELRRAADQFLDLNDMRNLRRD